MGGTFAWFTSSDTVTNRLTASADYGVSITEDFTPPEDWTPGQTVNKEVAAINTGNVSAFVKLSLTNAIEVTYESSDKKSYPITYTLPTNLTNYVKLARESSLVASTDTNATKTLDTGAIGTDPANEVASVQAGGMLVGAYITTDKGSTYGWADLTTEVGSQTVDSNGNDDGSTTEEVTLGKINSSSFTPSATGVYIFRRAITTKTDANDGTITDSYEYSGYYYDADSKNYYKLADNSITATTAPTFDRSEDKLTGAGEFTFSLVKKATDSTTPTFAWEYYSSSDKTYKTLDDDSTLTSYNCIRATYSRDGSVTTDDIVLHIKLNDDFEYNAESKYYTGEIWTAESTLASFYLNTVLEPGVTSDNLVKSITLDSNIDEDAYTNLIYDLNVNLNSVQVITDADGDITAGNQTAVTSDNNFVLKPTTISEDGTKITWSKPAG